MAWRTSSLSFEKEAVMSIVLRSRKLYVIGNGFNFRNGLLSQDRDDDAATDEDSGK